MVELEELKGKLLNIGTAIECLTNHRSLSVCMYRTNAQWPDDAFIGLINENFPVRDIWWPRVTYLKVELKPLLIMHNDLGYEHWMPNMKDLLAKDWTVAGLYYNAYTNSLTIEKRSEALTALARSY